MFNKICQNTAANSDFDYYKAGPKIYPTKTPNTCTHEQAYSADTPTVDKCKAITNQNECTNQVPKLVAAGKRIDETSKCFIKKVTHSGNANKNRADEICKKNPACEVLSYSLDSWTAGAALGSKGCAYIDDAASEIYEPTNRCKWNYPNTRIFEKGSCTQGT